jgi:hypothetical protein
MSIKGRTGREVKPFINKGLLAALDHYGEIRYDFKEPTMFTYRGEDGFQTAWCLEQTCQMAAEVLHREDLAVLKLKALQDGLKQYGLSGLYERIVGEKLP